MPVPAVQHKWETDCVFKENNGFIAGNIGLGARIKDLPERGKHKLGSVCSLLHIEARMKQQ